MTRGERRSLGRAARTRVPRAVHGEWKPAPDRDDPLDVLIATDRGRVASLLPIRYGRMLASPFAFLRGAAAIMAADLAPTPTSGARVQACGDAHIGNFGGFTTPERRQVFDLNDFDETLPAPWEWDVKRLVASVVVAGRGKGLDAADRQAAALTAIAGYHDRLRSLGKAPTLEAWYDSIELAKLIDMGNPHLRDRRRRRASRAQHDDVTSVRTLTRVDRGRPTITDAPPLVYHPRTAGERAMARSMHGLHTRYRHALRADAAALFDRFRVTDLAVKVVGVGSVGTRCGIALYAAGPGDLLILQIKEARQSVLEPYAGKSRFANHGERVVNGQRLMQAASDIFLGWTADKRGHQYYIRQLRDGKVKPMIDRFDARALAMYAGACGWALAGAHARTGDAARITGYLGRSDRFGLSVARFAERYADQTERDYDKLVAAVRHGRIRADTTSM
jgi:uncharacterized protein (DUF2252 family)